MQITFLIHSFNVLNYSTVCFELPHFDKLSLGYQEQINFGLSYQGFKLLGVTCTLFNSEKEFFLAFMHMNNNKLLVHCSERKGNGGTWQGPLKTELLFNLNLAV